MIRNAGPAGKLACKITAYEKTITLKEVWRKLTFQSIRPRRNRSPWNIGALTALAILLVPFASWATMELTDKDVDRAIENELFLQAGVSFHQIDVDVVNGVATLSGTVDNLLTKNRAEEIATMVRGVRSVVNTLEVAASGETDSQIRDDVERVLLTDPATDSYEVSVEVDDGHVVLEGTVDSWQEKSLAEIVATRVKGVRDIDNLLTVSYKHDRPDYEIKAEIERRMHWDIRVDNALINVEVDDGAVSLAGTVGSAKEKAQAGVLAWTAGVRSVDTSGLEVESWAREDRFRKDKYVRKSDEEIARAVTDAFVYDPRVFSFQPEVDVSNGVVTLTGVVDNLEAKKAAADDARNTVGVWRVRNLLKIRPETTLSDTEIADRVENALIVDPFTESYEISVAVHRGEVNLYGTVDSVFEKRQAADVAAGVLGVIDVDNHIDVERTDAYVTSWETAYDIGRETDDWEIRQEIKDQLFWSPFVDADQVNVVVNDGIATLTGEVDTWSERRAAEENAREGGALSVDNKLDVDYGPSWLE